MHEKHFPAWLTAQTGSDGIIGEAGEDNREAWLAHALAWLAHALDVERPRR